MLITIRGLFILYRDFMILTIINQKSIQKHIYVRMMLNIFLMFLSFKNSVCESFFRTNQNIVNFVENVRYDGAILEGFTTKSNIDCIAQCMAHSHCNSVNVCAEEVSNQRVRCEMIHASNVDDALSPALGGTFVGKWHYTSRNRYLHIWLNVAFLCF